MPKSKRERSDTNEKEKKRSRNDQQLTSSVGPKTEDSANKQFPSVINLNVGGKKITTQLSTLTKEPGSELAKRFNGEKKIEKDEDGRSFIDFDGEVFLHILNFLRLETLPPAEMALGVYDLANCLNIVSLTTILENYRSVQYRKRIEKLRSNAQQYEEFKQIVIEKINSSNASPTEGIVLLIYPEVRGQTCSDCRNIKFCDYVSNKCKDISVQIPVPVMNYYETLKDFKMILLSDLFEMGYAKCIHSKFMEETCRGQFGCNSVDFLEIALFTY